MANKKATAKKETPKKIKTKKILIKDELAEVWTEIEVEDTTCDNGKE